MLKTSGSCHKAKYLYKIHKEDVNDFAYLISKLPKRVSSISKHAKKRQREKGFRTSVKELNTLLIPRNLLDVQVGFDGEVTFVYRGSVDPLFDLTFVINRKNHVLTFWVNDKRDNHSTLDESIYRKDINIRDVL